MNEFERDLVRERHGAELERRGQINARADAQVSLVTVFVGIIAYFAASFPMVDRSWWSVTFVIGFAVLIVGTVASALTVGGLLWTDAADYLPNPSTNHAYLKELVEFYVGQNPDKGLARAEQEFVDEMANNFLQAADLNAKRNDDRDRLTSRSKRWVLRTIVGFVVTAVASLKFSAATK